MTLERGSLAAIFRKNNLLSEYEKQEPVFVWTEIAGELGKVARPKKVQGGSLVLEVPSAAAKQELSFLEEELLDKLNENLTHSKVDKLKFKLGQFSEGSGMGEKSYDIEEISLSEEEREKIEKELADTGLNEPASRSLKSLIVTQQKKRKVRLKEGWHECPACGGVFPDYKCSHCGFDRREVDTA
ncbi:DUF721 domain-containing protein [Candidatus Bipolaricaulota bacterium]|nr:DUF721 domain-containing protein [Candidatus Bipolaricaulota bacterium]